MNRRSLLSLLPLATILAACGKEAPAPTTPVEQTPANFIQALKKQGAGFTVGPAGDKPPIVVVFDAQCPHCGALWQMTEALRKERQFIWYPIAMLRSPANRPQGATLLESTTPEASMTEHEQSLLSHNGGISARGVSDASLAKVDANTAIAKQFALNSVPLILVTRPSGEVIVSTGVPAPQVLADLMR